MAAAMAVATETAAVRGVLQLASAAPAVLVAALAAVCAALRPPARVHPSRGAGGAARARRPSRLQARAR